MIARSNYVMLKFPYKADTSLTLSAATIREIVLEEASKGSFMIVEKIGPDVNGLNVGDKVFVDQSHLGMRPSTWINGELFYFMRDSEVIAIYEDTDNSKRPELEAPKSSREKGEITLIKPVQDWSGTRNKLVDKSSPKFYDRGDKFNPTTLTNGYEDPKETKKRLGL